MKPLLIVSDRGIDDPIFRSTTLHELTAIPSDQYVLWLARFESAQQDLSETPFYSSSFKRRVPQSLSLVPFLLRKRPSLVYVRNFWLYCIVLLVRPFAGFEVVYDVRGILWTESALKHQRPSRVLTLFALEQLLARRANQLLCVSEAAARLLRAMCIPEERIVVVPPNLPINPGPRDDTPVAIYAGGAQEWQGARSTIRFMSELQHYGVVGKVLTSDDGLASAAQHHGLQVTRRATHSAVLDALRASTAIISLRPDSLATVTAAPVKVFEAAASGCLIVGTCSTHERIGALEADGYALVVREPWDASDVRRAARRIIAHFNDDSTATGQYAQNAARILRGPYPRLAEVLARHLD